METPAVDVYLAYAAEQKDFAELLRILLVQAHHLSVFGEQSLEPGDPTRDIVQTTATAAAVVVVVISPEFVRKQPLMAELSAALSRQECAGGRSQQGLCPVFYNLTVEEFSRCNFREQLDEYTETVQELSEFVGLGQPQAQHYQGVFAMNAVDPVIHCLQAVGRLPEDYSLGMPQCHVPCNPRSLMGREEEEGCVLKGLQTKRCVIISGKPGEGKTALAQKGVWDMWERGELPGGAYCVDLAGVFEEQSIEEMSSSHMSKALADLLLCSMHEAEGPFWNPKEGWKAVEGCLHARDKLLLLFENAEDTQGTPQGRQEMARALEWLSGFSKTAVVVNSRTDIVCEHAEHVRIGNLDSAPAVELLREMCKEPSRQWKPDVAQQLAQLCEHKALLLVTVGSLIGAGMCTMQEAVSAGEVFLRLEEDASSKQSDSTHASRLRSWLLLYVPRQQQEAMCRLWPFGGGCEPEAAAAMLRSSSASPRASQETLRSLTAVSCLQLAAGAPRQRQPGSPPPAGAGAARYSMHPLIREVFRGEFDRLPEAARCGILRDFARVMAARMALIEALKHAGHWAEATRLLADDLLNFQELSSQLQSSLPCGDARPAPSLSQLMFLGNAMLAGLSRPGEGGGSQVSVAELASNILGPHHADTLVSNISIGGPDLELPARLYDPVPKDGQRLSALVYFHGGGFVTGGLDSHDSYCRALANGAPCVVISVAYRLGPEHPFPAAPEDCYAATQWVASHTEELGADSGLVAVAGDSAGANLAAAVTIMARDRQAPKLAFQLLLYPCVDERVGSSLTDHVYPSYAQFGPGSEGVQTTADAGTFMSMYKPDADDTRFGVLQADLGGLPPALMISCGMDFLRDECRAYVEKLQAAGVPAALKQFDRAFHAFLHYGVPETLEAMDASVQALRTAFGVHDTSPLSWAAFFGGSSIEQGSV